MLLGVPRLLTPDLLHALCAMGHGDAMVIVDANFPAASVARRVVGIVVDSVSDVVTLAPQDIRPAPEFGAAVEARFITGLGTLGERMLVLADIERLMTSRDMQLVDQTTHNA
jgi:chemotaxis signal transduction protein